MLQTLLDRQATFACTANLQRPPLFILPSLWACGDFVSGPYPATLEGAVRAARDYVRGALEAGAPVRTGAGSGPLNHAWQPQVMHTVPAA